MDSRFQDSFAALILGHLDVYGTAYPSEGVVVGIGKQAGYLLPALQRRYPHASYMKADAVQIGVRDGQADLIFGLNLADSLTYLQDKQRIFEEVRRVKRPEGIFFTMESSLYSMAEVRKAFYPQGNEHDELHEIPVQAGPSPPRTNLVRYLTP